MNIWDQKIQETHRHLIELVEDYEEQNGSRSIDLEFIEDGCHCGHPNVMAPCSWCEGGCPTEDIFNAWEAWDYAKDAEASHNRKIKVEIANAKYQAEQELREAESLGRKFT